MRIILASNSPRRKELLSSLNIEYECIPSNIEETFDEKLSKEEIVMDLAYRKGKSVYKKNQDAYVISADTIVYLDGEILNKPVDEKDAFEMIKKLSGKTHSVLTAVAFLNKEDEKVLLSESFVTFKKLSDKEINNYINIGESLDKAGAYGIQGKGKKLISKYEGDILTIIGFPLDLVKKELIKQNIYKEKTLKG